jgi:O-antigen/teichoic acid export membrane protein
VLPTYAIIDKVQRQINAALAPYITVLQGWVPRGKAAGIPLRARKALLVSAAGGAGMAVVLLLIAPALLDWLGRGEIQPPYAALVLMVIIIAVNMCESVVSKACLSALGRLDVAARATAIATVVGILLILVGAVVWGVLGALSGILAGLVLRIVLELLGMRRPGPALSGAPAPGRP